MIVKLTRSSDARSGSGKSRMTASPDPVPESTPDHEIILVPPVGQSGREQLLQECYDVRINVFHHEQGYSPDVVIDKLRLPSFAPLLSQRLIFRFLAD